MLSLVRLFMHTVEFLLAIPIRIIRLVTAWSSIHFKLGPLRHVVTAVVLYIVFAVLLVYVIAPIRGYVGHYYLGEKLRYDAERWLATALYDQKGNFVGTFDPRLDSVRDVNFTDMPIEVGDYIANPDHKSIPVRDVPEHFWQCLSYHEDRYIGTWLNPFGIDLLGVLKIPVSAVERSVALRRPAIGMGGSTLPMQIARVIYKTPPHAREGGLTKLSRKLSEWWLAPVIYRELTRNGDSTPLKEWAANHIWLAQRTGGSPLHGVEVTSRIVFGKEAKDLSVAEQYVLASAVNKPIILLDGSDRLNAVRLDRWRYIIEVRARTCAEKLINDPVQQKDVAFELVGLAGGPPDPRVRPKLQQALEAHAPGLARRAQANPVIRANALMPAARFGIREEMKQLYGFNWRNQIRGVTATLDVSDNLSFAGEIRDELVRINSALSGQMNGNYTLDPLQAGEGRRLLNVVVVAANAQGEIVRYYESGQMAPYFGSAPARDRATGLYDRAKEGRMIASTGKVIAAVAIANSGRDGPQSLYVDTHAPERGLESCRKGDGRYGRQAIVAFACSLNSPLLNRTALAGQRRVRHIIDRLGFTMPPRSAAGEDTPPSTAAVLGQISGSPRRVHMMSATVLAAMTGKHNQTVRLPTLVKKFDFTSPEAEAAALARTPDAVMPSEIINRSSVPLLRTLLQAPLCYEAYGRSHGTLKSLSKWCATRRKDLRLHFAKTGTQVTEDPNATVDVWMTGGLQFTNGQAYSYVVLAGTGSASEPWGVKLHAAQVAAPLAKVLLESLSQHARKPAMQPGPAHASNKR